jgi:hypothetical protein
LTAICRPSLWLAPAFLIEAPALSGAGHRQGAAGPSKLRHRFWHPTSCLHCRSRSPGA